MQKLRFERNKVIRNIKSSAYSVRPYLLVKYLHLSYVQRSIDTTNPCIDNNRHFITIVIILLISGAVNLSDCMTALAVGLSLACFGIGY